MISWKLLFYLSIGTSAMLIPIMLQAAWYKIKLWKSVLIAVVLTITGTIGTYLWFYIENHWIGGTSFYGAVFMVPVIFWAIAKLLRIPYGELMDLCAPAECVMLAIMKVQCMISGCCQGVVLFTTNSGTAVRFPSQILEMINALVILALLMVFAYKKPKRGDIFPWYMVIYGGTRFILNLFRENQSDFFLGMSPGNVWSLLAILIGVVWLFVMRKRVLSKERDNVVI